MRFGVLALATALLLAGCYKVDTLEGTSAEQVRVDGRLFTIRVGPTGSPNTWRLLVQRATMVLNPDSELETERAQTVARQIMERTCKGGRYSQAIEGMDGINYKTVFTCL
jgi:hypothetical protein